MKLSDWLEAHPETSNQSFGDRIGKSGAAVSRYATGKRRPDEETLIKIYVATDGQVTPNDFVNLPDLEADTADDEDLALNERDFA